MIIISVVNKLTNVNVDLPMITDSHSQHECLNYFYATRNGSPENVLKRDNV
jgi:hypothetical protein